MRDGDEVNSRFAWNECKLTPIHQFFPVWSILCNNFELGNNEFRKYKYLCPHYTDEAYHDDPYYYYDYGISRPVLSDAGKKYSM